MRKEFLKLLAFFIRALLPFWEIVHGLKCDKTVFYKKAVFVNRQISNLSLWTESEITSEGACASECFKDSKCVSFFYNKATLVCTGHAVQFYGTEPSQESDKTKYYTRHVGKRDCAEILSNDKESEDGVYTINPIDGKGAISVYCDMTTEGGGWTVFQRRKDGSVDFYLNWTEYRKGFGNPDGNDNIHRLSNARVSALRIDMLDQANQTGYAEYTDFYIDGETDKYRLHINVFTGDRRDSLIRHNNLLFSTKDQDNDNKSRNCAQISKGGWWYDNCHDSNLNGVYGSTTYSQCVSWYVWHGHEVSLKQTEMKMRPQ